MFLLKRLLSCLFFQVILVTGGTGLVGKGIEAIATTEEKRSDEVWIFLSSKDADLTNEASTKAIFEVSSLIA